MLKAAFSLSCLVPQEKKKVHSLHPRWRQLCQSSLFRRKLTRLPPILPLLLGGSLPFLERVQTSDWTNATSLTDYETGPPATPPPAPPGWAPAAIFGSAGKRCCCRRRRGRQKTRRLHPQRSPGARWRLVLAAAGLLCGVLAGPVLCIAVSFPPAPPQLHGSPASVARDQVYRIVCPILLLLILFSVLALHITFSGFSLFFCLLLVFCFICFLCHMALKKKCFLVLLKVHWSIFDPSLLKNI